MARFEPFAAIRYRTDDGYLDDLVCPPYDVISPEERTRLAARHQHNAVHLELPVDYDVAATLWEQWRANSVLVADPEPSFYVYRMGFHDDAGRPRQTTGVLGALELSPPAIGAVLPHEHTTPKDKADRLELLRACRANISPVWGLSLASGLAGLCEPNGPPDARATDDDGVHHRLWRVTQPGVLDAMHATVGSAPVLIADGHHRYEVALAYQAEAEVGTELGAHGADLVLAYVVELSDEQLSVRPIHRLLSGVPDGFDVLEALTPHFGAEPAPVAPDALMLVTAGGSWRLTPTPATEAAIAQDLDSCRIEMALASLPPITVTYQHGIDNVRAAVDAGAAQAGILLRPAAIDQIAATGRGGQRMPPKTTFFHPKPRTGLVFRSLT